MAFSISACCGARSAATRFLASSPTLTPEPPPRAVIIDEPGFVAAAELLAVVGAVLVTAVFTEDVDVVDVTAID